MVLSSFRLQTAVLCKGEGEGNRGAKQIIKRNSRATKKYNPSIAFYLKTISTSTLALVPRDPGKLGLCIVDEPNVHILIFAQTILQLLELEAFGQDTVANLL